MNYGEERGEGWSIEKVSMEKGQVKENEVINACRTKSAIRGL